MQSGITLMTLPQRDRLRSHANAASASISADGRYIAFSSYERLTAADEDDYADIYLLDRQTGAVTLESIAVEGTPLRSDCTFPRLSGDGRFLVFQGVLDVGGSPGQYADVVLRDRLENTTRALIPRRNGETPNGWSSGAVISDDGRVVVFESTATNLVAGIDANGARSDIYLVETADGQLRRISVDEQGVQPADAVSISPAISADGRHVAFVSSGRVDPRARVRTRQNSSSSQVRRQVYIHDTQLQVSRPITPAAGGAPNDSSYLPAISRDGRYVAFVSTATNWGFRDRNRSPDVFLYDAGARSITLVSRGRNGEAANGASSNPSISADGRFVAFQSDAADLVCRGPCAGTAEDINLLPDVFLFDRVTGAIRLVSAGEAGTWMEESTAPALDAQGHILAFTSKHPIDARDIGHDFDLFVRIPAGPR